jgi:regulator of protease activity HflC (stomatin/prohibitin superfamily)
MPEPRLSASDSFPPNPAGSAPPAGAPPPPPPPTMPLAPGELPPDDSEGRPAPPTTSAEPAGAEPPRPRSWFRRMVRAVLTLPRRMWRNAGEVWEEHKVVIVITLFGFAFLVAFLWKSIFVKIGPGEAGVIYRLFRGGTDVTHVYGEGLHVVFPFNTMYTYNARVQQVGDKFVVLSQDGLAIEVEVSIRYRPQYSQLGLLHKNIGPDYVEKVVVPEVQSAFRFVLGQYKPEDIYTSQGFILQTVVQGALGQLAERYILLDDLLLKAVTLPRPVAESIESKLRAQQLAAEYDYRIMSEKKEAERKGIEAGGIRDFQNTITGNGISEQFLRFKGIEATLELAKSQNAKIVIIGGGDDRLPLILDGASRTPEVTLPLAAPPAKPPVRK